LPALQPAHLVASTQPPAAALITAAAPREKSPERIRVAAPLPFYRAGNEALQEEKARTMTTFLIGSAVVLLTLFVIGLYSGVTILHELE
jgi:hypothetical protein